MRAFNLLGFDFGASSVRAMLGTLAEGKLRIKEIHRFSNDPVMLCGRYVWDVLRLVYEMKQALMKIPRLGITIDAIGIDPWGADSGLLDKNGHMLGLPVHYRDDRTLGIREKVRDVISDRELFSRTGIAYNQYNSLYTIPNEGAIDGSIRLLTNIMGLWIIQECKRDWDRCGDAVDFAALVKMAMDAPAFQAMIEVDDPCFMAPGNMPSRIQEYCQKTGQSVPKGRSDISRVIYESLLF